MLESPVRRIVQRSRGVSVHSDRVKVRAKRVIVAVPPILTGKIDYEPGLPDERVELIDHFPRERMTKAACVYERPFWRDDGLTGQVLYDRGPLSATFDDSPEDGSRGVVFGFVGGDQARSFSKLSEAQAPRGRDRQLRRVLRPAGGQPDAATSRPPGRARPGPEAVRSGSPASARLAARGPGAARARRRIHWAGTETSDYWAGYMDGAVRSGERAAAEVIERL